VRIAVPLYLENEIILPLKALTQLLRPPILGLPDRGGCFVGGGSRKALRRLWLRSAFSRWPTLSWNNLRSLTLFR